MNQKNQGLKCITANCDKDAVCKQLCTKHYQQMKLRGSIIQKEYVYIDGICSIIGCNNKSFSKGLCQNHYLKQH